jgi:hypothetical protein
MKHWFFITATLMVFGIAPITGISQGIVLDENFDGVANGALPDGWTVLYGDTYNGFDDATQQQVACDPPCTGWQVLDGVLDSGVGDHDREALFITVGGGWADTTVQVDLVRAQGTGYMGTATNVQANGDRYECRYMTGDPGGVLNTEGTNAFDKRGENPVVWLVQRVNGAFTVLAQAGNVADLEKGPFHPMEMTAIGTSLSCSAAGATVEATALDALGPGGVGFSNGEYGVFFDNVLVTASATAVDPKSKLAATWGQIKEQ